MNHSECSRKARKNIKANTKQKLLRYSSFGCSICGKIPIVFHHIEEWSKKFLNNEKYLIPICDACHRSIHGKGGPVLTKKELYKYKSHPNGSRVLKYKYSLERKQNYSFFVGSNLVANGKRATLFRFGGYPLTTVDTSLGILKLSVLVGIQNNKPHYLIKDNELMIDTDDVWKMEFSVPTLKIWKKTKAKKIVFIDLIIKPDVIIIREMNTIFNGKEFKVYKLRFPQGRQLNKIASLVKTCEKYYLKSSAIIDKQPKIAGFFNGVNLDKMIKDTKKNALKYEIEMKLKDIISKELGWKRYYIELFWDDVIKKSSVFKKPNKTPFGFSKELIEISKMSERLKRKYRKEFEELKNVIVDYGGMILTNNMVL